MRLIDANELLETITKNVAENLTAAENVGRIIIAVTNAPTADAVEVVRCKDCKNMEVTPDCLRWCNAWGSINGMGDEGFCNYGERRTNEG